MEYLKEFNNINNINMIGISLVVILIAANENLPVKSSLTRLIFGILILLLGLCLMIISIIRMTK